MNILCHLGQLCLFGEHSIRENEWHALACKAGKKKAVAYLQQPFLFPGLTV